MNLIDRIIDNRVKFFNKLREHVRNNLTGDFQTDYDQLVTRFLENPRAVPYFNEKYEEAGAKPISWKGLEKVSDIAGSSTIHHDSISGQFEQVRSCVDNYFMRLSESTASLPFFYTQESGKTEPNCVGASQVISALYSFDKPIDNLELVVVCSTSRRDNILKFLKNLDSLSQRDDEILEVKVDSFEGGFSKEEIRDKLFDYVLLLEESGHIAVREKAGETFDYELERENYKRYEVCPIKQGLWAATTCNLITLYDYLGLPSIQSWKRVREKVRGVSRYISVTMDYSLGLGNFNQLQNVFGEDLPARYYMTEMVARKFDIQFNQEAMNHIRKTYPHPKALEIIGKRYLSEEDYSAYIAPYIERNPQSPVRKLR